MAIAALGQTDTARRGPLLFHIGLSGSYNWSTMSGSTFIDEFFDDCVPDFTSGTERSITGSLLGEIPFDSIVSMPALLGLRIGVVRTLDTGRLEQSLGEPTLLRDNAGALRPAATSARLDYDRTDVMLSAYLGVSPVPRVAVSIGLSASRAIGGEQRLLYHAITPGLTFANERVDSVLRTASIVSSALALSSDLALRYDLPISESSTLSPELSFSYQLTSRQADRDWRGWRLGAGLALRFGVRGAPPIDTTPVVVPPPPPPQLAVSILTQPPVVEVHIDEYDSIEALPLLNQIFFAMGDSVLPSRYALLSKDSAATFATRNLLGPALEIYYNLLNIVGERMLLSQQARERVTLQINGYRSGSESTPGLGLARARAVRDYLVNVWGINPSRLKVGGGTLPPDPARETTREGMEENARVEIVASDPNITRPVVRRHIRRVATPPGITFYPRVESDTGVASWRLTVDQNGTPWRVFSGAGAPPDSIPWNWRSDRASLPELPMQLSYTLSVVDRVGQTRATAPASISVSYSTRNTALQHREGDTTVESYSLLLFNYDSPRVSSSDNELLQAITAAGVSSRAVVRFTGYTDSIGDAGHNRALANQRAQETARIFKSLAPRGVTIIVDPNGGESERFPYSTPEGRSHDRTVVIEIRTPSAEKKDL